MRRAHQIWTQLSVPWQAAFAEAWTSYCEGNLGIGAVLVEPETATVVATGRNRVNSTTPLPRTLSGNFMAHAEMNAFAALNRHKADGLDIYTTLQPCLMCAATAVFMHVETVRFAAGDEYFAVLSDLWQHHAYSDRNKPTEIGPLEPPLATSLGCSRSAFKRRRRPEDLSSKRPNRTSRPLQTWQCRRRSVRLWARSAHSKATSKMHSERCCGSSTSCRPSARWR